MGSGVQRGSNVTSTATSSTSGNRARRRWTPSTMMPPAGQPGVAIRNVLALLQASFRRAHLRVEDLSIFGVRQRIALSHPAGGLDRPAGARPDGGPAGALPPGAGGPGRDHDG